MTSSKNQINNCFLHKSTGSIDDSFIGIKIKNNRIDFYYPEAYDIADTNNIPAFRKDILSIINTIAIAKSISSDKTKIETTLASQDSFALHSYLWIIKDYLSNGLYINREKTLKRNQSGKINWKRTMQQQPIISNKNVIYTDIIVEKPNQIDNIIVEIHKHCIHRSLKYIGWLFNLSPSIISPSPFNNNRKKIYLAALQKELNNTFDDNKKTKLSHMLKIIKGISGNDNNDEFVYGVDSYYYIFEKMIDSIFSNVNDIKQFYPKSSWYLKKEGYKKIPSSELRPDTILLVNTTKTAYIIDSKYYRFGVTNLNSDLPSSTSIQKQITYGEYIKQNHKDSNIENIRSAFILPYNKNNNKLNLKSNLEYIGYSSADWKDNTEDHQIIFAFLIDLKYTIQTWNSNHFPSDTISSFIENIEAELKTLTH